MKKVNNSTIEEISFHVSEYYKNNKRAPRIKDIRELPFSRDRVKLLFGTWNNMLRYADVPLNRAPPKLLECFKCKKRFMRQVKEIRKSKHQFCGSQCNASYYTTGRKVTQETKDKISATLKAHRIFNPSGAP